MSYFPVARIPLFTGEIEWVYHIENHYFDILIRTDAIITRHQIYSPRPEAFSLLIKNLEKMYKENKGKVKIKDYQTLSYLEIEIVSKKPNKKIGTPIECFGVFRNTGNETTIYFRNSMYDTGLAYLIYGLERVFKEFIKEK